MAEQNILVNQVNREQKWLDKKGTWSFLIKC